jgi:hypothetical protein
MEGSNPIGLYISQSYRAKMRLEIGRHGTVPTTPLGYSVLRESGHLANQCTALYEETDKLITMQGLFVETLYFTFEKTN